MQENSNNNSKKTQEKLLLLPGKPRRTRIIVLKTLQYLMLYSASMTVRELVKKLENDGHPVHYKLMCDFILKDLAALPPPGYQLHTTLTRVGNNKKVPAYTLKKIQWQKTNTYSMI